MSGAQSLIGVGGLALVAADFWTGPQRDALGGVVWHDKGASPAAGHRALLQIAGELVLVGVLVLLAGASDGFAALGVGLVGVLWLGFALTHYGRHATTGGITG